MGKARVLIVDDSAVVRSVLTSFLSQDTDIEVVCSAVDPYDARDKIKLLKPDVLTLDVEMPRMDGITFLRNLMKLNPMPVVMLSSLTHKGAGVTLDALEIGAVDFIAKPTTGQSDEALKLFQQEVCEKVKTAASSAEKLKFRRSAPAAKADSCEVTKNVTHHRDSLIAIGASTGGTEALRDVLTTLPVNMPPIVITQHIPASFSNRFASRLNEQCALTVQEAKEGDVLRSGHVYIAPGSHHLKIRRHGHQMICALDDGEPVNRHKPSVEVMFASICELSPEHVIAVMLTGMGEDGSRMMKTLADAGAHSLVQDEASSLVWGMPGSAVKYGAAKEIAPLDKIATRLVNYLTR